MEFHAGLLVKVKCKEKNVQQYEWLKYGTDTLWNTKQTLRKNISGVCMQTLEISLQITVEWKRPGARRYA